MFIKPAPNWQRGVTLVELIVFIMVVSVGLAGVMTVFNVTVRASADPLLNKQALAVADATMEEILLKDFCDPDLAPACTPSVEAARADYDNVDDFNACTLASPCEVSPAGAIPELSGYMVTVTSLEPAADVAGVDKAQVRLVTVRVLVNGTTATELSGYRFNYDS